MIRILSIIHGSGTFDHCLRKNMPQPGHAQAGLQLVRQPFTVLVLSPGTAQPHRRSNSVSRAETHLSARQTIQASRLCGTRVRLSGHI